MAAKASVSRPGGPGVQVAEHSHLDVFDHTLRRACWWPLTNDASFLPPWVNAERVRGQKWGVQSRSIGAQLAR